MSKRRVAIVDDDGRHLMACYLSAESSDLEGAQLDGLLASGITTLRGRNFAGASLYVALLQDADLSGCNFEGVDLRGANLKGARLFAACLRDADLGRDAWGVPARLQGADLREAMLHDCRLSGTEYDADTRFPPAFDPDAAGMVEAE